MGIAEGRSATAEAFAEAGLRRDLQAAGLLARAERERARALRPGDRGV